MLLSFYLCEYMCISMWVYDMCVGVWVCPRKPEEWVRSLGVGVVSSYESSHLGTGNKFVGPLEE